MTYEKSTPNISYEHANNWHQLKKLPLHRRKINEDIKDTKYQKDKIGGVNYILRTIP